MSLKRVAPALAVVALLSACASMPESDHMTWGYAQPSSQEGPKLAFGVDGTDYLAVLFLCEPASGSITFNVPVGEGQDVAEVKLRSGGVVRGYDTLPSEPDGYELAYFRTDRADPVVKAFARSGRLAINVYGAFISHNVKTAPERVAVANFAKACGLG
ncbi:hypothetical protein [Caulobacter sp.]|uniref:hypothetical protein n=1 Tax=Caulobacter sp. TaxID=78 RepID=UPI003BAE6A07